ncbi:hypothetical protein LJC32_03920 [Oscillospiraceae bacterium OttesenSCG-928-F05]|nr:hypothetical protein [Oscillospiraceae bacterium OttesenSCG-928-F05]
MKKSIRLKALLLAFALLLGAVPGTALAEEPFTHVYFWDDAQWEAAGGWSDDQWIAYMDWEYDYWPSSEEEDEFYTQMEIAYMTWDEARWDLYYRADALYWDYLQENWEKERKAAEGYPYLEGLNVMVDGVFLKGDHGQPELRGGVAMAAAGDLYRMLGGENAPEDPALYIPIRQTAEDLGFTVLWDAYNQVVVIIDVEKLLSDIDGRFELLNKMLTQWQADPAKNYASDISMVGSGTLYGDKEHATASLTYKGTGVSGPAGSRAELTTECDVSDFKDIIDTLVEPYFDEEDYAILEAVLSKNTYGMIVDSETGDGYIKTSLAPYIFGDADVTGDTWVHYAPPENWEAEALTEIETVGGLLYTYGMATTLDGYYNDAAGLYSGMMEQAAALELFFGDSQFKKQVSGSVTRYTLKHTTATFVAGLAQAGLLEMEDLLDYRGEEISLPVINYEMTLTEKSGTVTGCAMKGSVGYMGLNPMTLTFDLEMAPLQMKGDIQFAGRFIGKAGLQFAVISKETAAGPDLEPDGEVIEYDDIYGRTGYVWTDELENAADILSDAKVMLNQNSARLRAKAG